MEVVAAREARSRPRGRALIRSRPSRPPRRRCARGARRARRARARGRARRSCRRSRDRRRRAPARGRRGDRRAGERREVVAVVRSPRETSRPSDEVDALLAEAARHLRVGELVQSARRTAARARCSRASSRMRFSFSARTRVFTSWNAASRARRLRPAARAAAPPARGTSAGSCTLALGLRVGLHDHRPARLARVARGVLREHADGALRIRIGRHREQRDALVRRRRPAREAAVRGVADAHAVARGRLGDAVGDRSRAALPHVGEPLIPLSPRRAAARGRRAAAARAASRCPESAPRHDQSRTAIASVAGPFSAPSAAGIELERRRSARCACRPTAGCPDTLSSSSTCSAPPGCATATRSERRPERGSVARRSSFTPRAAYHELGSGAVEARRLALGAIPAKPPIPTTAISSENQ